MYNKLHFRVEHITKEDIEWVFREIEKEKDVVGYYSLPNQNIEELMEWEKEVSKEIKDIVVIGIGGSSLGSRAVYEFIKPLKNLKRRLFFFESTDPISINATLREVDLKRALILIISKSGTTIETIALFKYFYSLQNNLDKYIFITDINSKLDKLAKELKVKTFYIPKSVGGRFSVLSSVGLIPLVLAGVDIELLLEGARKIRVSFFEEGYIREILLKKAIFYAKHLNEYNINVLFAYSEAMEYFLKWYIQLWGESLGKRQECSIINIGLTPIGLIGPKDQHSFLQLLMEGNRDKTVTFIKIENKENDLAIPNFSLKYLDELDILNNISFNELINMQCDATKEALLDNKEIPVDEIILNRANEYSIGELIFYYELLTSLVGRLINVDTYNQPGVELGKTILKNKLRRGFD